MSESKLNEANKHIFLCKISLIQLSNNEEIKLAILQAERLERTIGDIAAKFGIILEDVIKPV